MPTIKPKVRQDLTVVELDGEAVIYDEHSGNIHHLNGSATAVFLLCDGQATTKRLAQDIAEIFRIQAEDVERDVRALLRDFREAGLLEAPGEQADRLLDAKGARVDG